LNDSIKNTNRKYEFILNYGIQTPYKERITPQAQASLEIQPHP